MVRRTIGIDLAIRGDHVARVFDDGQPVGRPLRFRLTSASLTGFVARVTGDLPEGATITAVMEPTGMSWFPVANWLRRAGIAVIRVKGQRVKALRRYLSEHTKTDAVDAYVLGAMPGFGSVALDPVYVPSAEQHALQRLTKQRHRLDSLVCSGKRRLIDLTRWACPALEAVLPGAGGRPARPAHEPVPGAARALPRSPRGAPRPARHPRAVRGRERVGQPSP